MMFQKATPVEEQKVYSNTVYGHGVSRTGDRFEVYAMSFDLVDRKVITTLARESDAWTLCIRLRKAWARGSMYETKAMRAQRVRRAVAS